MNFLRAPLLAWLLLAVSLLLPPGGATLPAQGEAVTVIPSLGFDGYYRPGKWTPVFVEVSNQPSAGARLSDLRDFEGQLMVQTSPEAGADGSVRFARPIDVPAGSRKLYVVYARFPPAMTSPPLLSVNTPRGRLLRVHNLHAAELSDDEILAVDISEAAARPRFPSLGGGLDRILAGRLSPLALPEHWAGWDAVDLITLPRWPDRGILPEALAAIRDHVQMGATLVILGGNEMPTYADPAARALLPVEPATLLSLVEEGGAFAVVEGVPQGGAGREIFPLAAVTPKPGAEVLASVDGHPLLVREAHGNGQILFLALDLRSSSPALDALLAPHWNALLPERNLADWSREVPGLMGSFQAISGRAARPPNTALIILVCIVYTIVAGPLNFAILIRRKKVEWAWFTLPAIVLLFFLLIYGLGRLTKEEQLALRELRVETYHGGQGRGSFTSYATLFSSRPLNLGLLPGEGQLVADTNRWWQIPPHRERTLIGTLRETSPLQQRGGGATPPLLSYDTAGERIHSPSWPIRTFDVRTFTLEGPTTLDGTIHGNLHFDGRTLSGTLTNDTPHTYHWAALIAGGRHLPLGNVGPHQTRDIAGGSLAAGLPTLPSAGESPLDPLTAHNLNLILRGMYRPEATGATLPPNPGGVTFVGLREQDDSAAPTAELSVTPDITRRDVATLVHFHAPPPPGSRFELNEDALAHRLLRIEPVSDRLTGDLTFDQAERMILRNARAVLALDFPFRHAGMQVETLAIRPSASIRGNMELRVSVYNWKHRRWEPISHLTRSSDGIVLPGTGRMYISMEATPGNPDAGVGWDAGVTVSEIQVTMSGRIQPGQ